MMMRMIALLKLVVLATILAEQGRTVFATDVDLELDNEHSGRLVQDRKDRLAEANDLDEDPVVADKVDKDAPRVVKKHGPITRKIVATRDKFSLHAWKFAGRDGTVHGVMEEGSVKVGIDCLLERDDGSAILGGVEAAKGDSRAYVLISSNNKKKNKSMITELKTGFALDTNCDTIKADKFKKHNKGVSVKICNKHDGEAEWIKCTENSAKSEL